MRTIVKVKRKMKMYWQNNSVMCSVSSVLLFVVQVRHPLNPSRTMIRATHGVTSVLQTVSVEYHYDHELDECLLLLFDVVDEISIDF